MNFKKYVSFIVIILFLGIVAFFLANQNILLRKASGNDVKFVKIGDVKVKVELAFTHEEQEQGLSGRKSLEEGTGMLFIFPKPGKYFFWMKDMNFPIDIVWIDENFRVTYIEKNALPSSYPNSFGPTVDNSYILEVLDGFAEKNNLKIGDSVEFLR